MCVLVSRFAKRLPSSQRVCSWAMVRHLHHGSTPQRWGKPDKIKLSVRNWVFTWKFPACRAFQMDIGRKEAAAEGDCVVVLRHPVQSRSFHTWQNSPCCSVSRAFSCMSTSNAPFWTICTPVSATSERLLPLVARQALTTPFVWLRWPEGLLVTF